MHVIMETMRTIKNAYGKLFLVSEYVNLLMYVYVVHINACKFVFNLVLLINIDLLILQLYLWSADDLCLS